MKILLLLLFLTTAGYSEEFTPPYPDPCPDGSCDADAYYVEIWPDGNQDIVIREWLLLKPGQTIPMQTPPEKDHVE